MFEDWNSMQGRYALCSGVLYTACLLPELDQIESCRWNITFWFHPRPIRNDSLSQDADHTAKQAYHLTQRNCRLISAYISVMHVEATQNIMYRTYLYCSGIFLALAELETRKNMWNEAKLAPICLTVVSQAEKPSPGLCV